MKLVKAVNSGIVTYQDGVLYEIGSEAITVSDEVAEKLSVQFGHLLDVTTVIETVVTQTEESTDEKKEEIVEEKPVKVKKDRTKK